MENLINAISEESTNKLKKDLAQLETEEGLKNSLGWHHKTYKGDIKGKLIKHIKRDSLKRLNEQLAKIATVQNAPDFAEPFIITVEWRPSRIWRSNPKAYTNFGFESESIGGCGYDKKSTATAAALNSHLPILKMLYLAKDKIISEHKNDTMVKEYYGDNMEKIYKTEPMDTADLNRKFLGYGAGYSVLPRFEGGVGVESHRGIIEGLGLKFEQVTNTPNTDVFVITK